MTTLYETNFFITSVFLGVIAIGSIGFFYLRERGEVALFDFPDVFECLPLIKCDKFVSVYNISSDSEIRLEGSHPQGVSLEERLLSVSISEKGQWPLKLTVRDRYKKWKNVEKSFILTTKDRSLDEAWGKAQQYILETSGERFMRQIVLKEINLQDACGNEQGCKKWSDKAVVFYFDYLIPDIASQQRAIMGMVKSSGAILYAHGFPSCVQTPSECNFLSKDGFTEKARRRQLERWVEFPSVTPPQLIWARDYNTFAWRVVLKKSKPADRAYVNLLFDANDGELLEEREDPGIYAL
ncbi:hypothetical protein HYV71_01795 [Candidatus Uhrbacteria bacterium]|nr:hypothetical protein [Candidatus Uhrbacteria bacterium]